MSHKQRLFSVYLCLGLCLFVFAFGSMFGCSFVECGSGVHSHDCDMGLSVGCLCGYHPGCEWALCIFVCVYQCVCVVQLLGSRVWYHSRVGVCVCVCLVVGVLFMVSLEVCRCHGVCAAVYTAGLGVVPGVDALPYGLRQVFLV